MEIDVNTLPKALCCGQFLRICVTSRQLDADGHYTTTAGNTVLYVRRDISRKRLVEVVCGYASMAWARLFGDKNAKWFDGLWIGAREMEVRLVRSGICSDALIDWENNRVSVRSTWDSVKLITRLFAAANRVFLDWEKRAVRRAWKREKPVVTPEPQPEPVARPKRRKRITENLSAAQNERHRNDFEAAVAKIISQASDNEPRGGDNRTSAA